MSTRKPLRSGARTIGILLLALVVGGPTCFGQASASLTGVLTDQNGAIVPGAKVTLTNTNTKETRAASSNAEGRYTFSLLIPGSYQLEIEAAGFKKSVSSAINLLGGQAAEENVKLELGTVQETVEVTAQAVASA